jgi:transcriptional regulator GlxA family with amidase domain
MALRGTLRIRPELDDEWMGCGAALVRPDAKHEVDARNTAVLIAFVESESELGAALGQRLRENITRISARTVARWRTALGDVTTLSAAQVEGWVRGELLRETKVPELHPRVKRVLRFVRKQLGDPESLSLQNLAKIAGLSTSRFGHVFTESVGVSLRPYILWLRLQRASGELMRGVSVTEAAHSAGFSDAAHMTRTFRRMLGTSPSELVRRRQAGRAAFVQTK